jgi:hypothetical protein
MARFGPGHPRPPRTPSEHRELVAQDQYLNLLGVSEYTLRSNCQYLWMKIF